MKYKYTLKGYIWIMKDWELFTISMFIFCLGLIIGVLR